MYGLEFQCLNTIFQLFKELNEWDSITIYTVLGLYWHIRMHMRPVAVPPAVECVAAAVAVVVEGGSVA